MSRLIAEVKAQNLKREKKLRLGFWLMLAAMVLGCIAGLAAWKMSAFTELLQTLGLGHWLVVAGGVLIVLGVLGRLIRRSRRTGSEVEDEVTRRPDARLNQTETPSERAEDRPFGRDGS
jgi:hypothetical protein